MLERARTITAKLRPAASVALARLQPPWLVNFLRSDLAFILLLAIVSRISIFAVAELYNFTFDIDRSFDGLMCTFDCAWYADISDNGYMTGPLDFSEFKNWAFFPLFPLAGAAVSAVSGVSSFAALTIVSNISFIAGLAFLFRYVRSTLGADVGRATATLMAFSPYSLYLSAPYSESLYFLLLVSCLYCAQNNRWLLAGAIGALLSATRNLGVFIVFPILVMGLSQIGWRDMVRFAGAAPRFWLCIFLIPLGLFSFMYFLNAHVGDGLAFMHAQEAWKRSFGNPVEVIWNGFARIHETVWLGVFAFAGCIGFATTAYLVYKRRITDGLVIFIGVLLPSLTGLEAMPRFVSSLYPVYLALALLTVRWPGARTLIIGITLPISSFMIFAWLNTKYFMT